MTRDYVPTDIAMVSLDFTLSDHMIIIELEHMVGNLFMLQRGDTWSRTQTSQL